MRLVNAAGRAALVFDGRLVDVVSASAGRWSARVHELYESWDTFSQWVRRNDAQLRARAVNGPQISDVRLAAPVPFPRQVFAIGLNYREHAREGGAEIPSTPMVFTKFPSAITGPTDSVVLPSQYVDFEAELVVVIGKPAEGVGAHEAWHYVAGLTLGQDLSERAVQTAPPKPQQYSLAKSYRGFAPVGPVLATPDEFANPDDVEISCHLNGVEMQRARTSDLIFDVPHLVEYLSSIVTLLPGDLVFTGTPSGIGWVRDPRVVLRPDDVLVTSGDRIGSMRNTFTRPTK
ncbi:fumarylacetoacetate hydrolase family protein [Streptomyces cadmiisoli]|uniref:Fumarylacetoacetate hydrolase n=1 Tax=Streptomyces cadmiisoli TaxID=2184053 RepID=A0A2Z4JAD4_9ACTN|nr:fumarylacetoacetate hydrolase family protein [Streptomyces cadmiisoli]AWW42192.1 fumarylacetoacetate hydrolase [Streptomyces cadmiisoli]